MSARGQTAAATLVVVGTGDLSRAVCYSLATAIDRIDARVVVVGRRRAQAEQLCFVAGARAAASGRLVRFEPADDLDKALDQDLTGVLVLASTQSPWERLDRPSGWTRLVQRAGFGVTLPFQAELALRAGQAVAGRGWLVNGCFPDAVNPLLAAIDVPVLCGIGNIGLLAASAQAALGLPDQGRLCMLAHHLHLHEPPDGEPEALAWLDGEPVDAAPLLAGQRACDRPELNFITGHTAALLAGHLLAGTQAGTELLTHLPGPHGLPGGYPVTVRGAEVSLRLPDGVSRAAAIEFNQRAALADGATVQDDLVRFGPAAATALEPFAPALAAGFPVSDLASATAELQAVRDRLRSTTADEETR